MGAKCLLFCTKTQGIRLSFNPADNQLFDCTTFVTEDLNVHGNELHLFMGHGIPPTLTNNVAHLNRHIFRNIFELGSKQLIVLKPINICLI